MPASPWPPPFEATLRSYLPLLTPEQDLKRDLVLVNYGLDSLAAVGLLLDLEDQFQVTISDEHLNAITRIDAYGLWAAIESVRQTAGTEPALADEVGRARGAAGQLPST
ncbi:acyl carrier protein [Streptomyces sp. NPDC127098]|uniref:acyl carrier protein n=1 Tax=Streptomyces sp. NPDC127098 TaxID=3347137 RepID=UPI0036695C8A